MAGGGRPPEHQRLRPEARLQRLEVCAETAAESDAELRRAGDEDDEDDEDEEDENARADDDETQIGAVDLGTAGEDRKRALSLGDALPDESLRSEEEEDDDDDDETAGSKHKKQRASDAETGGESGEIPSAGPL